MRSGHSRGEELSCARMSNSRNFSLPCSCSSRQCVRLWRSERPQPIIGRHRALVDGSVLPGAAQDVTVLVIALVEHGSAAADVARDALEAGRKELIQSLRIRAMRKAITLQRAGD